MNAEYTGKKIAELRKDKNLTQKELADQLHVTDKAVSKWERGAGLPDVSPHDLRHTCASLLLSSGADIKSVQEILGHADARTTLNFYVKADLSQMRMATEKYAAAFNL